MPPRAAPAAAPARRRSDPFEDAMVGSFPLRRRAARTPRRPGVARGSVGVMLVAVFADAHAHAEALEAVVAAADASGAEQLWSLGDMVGGGPDPEHVVALTRERCAVALLGNHDYGATGAVDPQRFGEPGSAV